MPTIKTEPLSSSPIPSSSSSSTLSSAPSSSQLDLLDQPSLSPAHSVQENDAKDTEAVPPVLYLAVGRDMNPVYMQRLEPSAQILDFARLDNYEYIIDHRTEQPCVSPCPQTQTRTNTHTHNSKKLVYGLLYELPPDKILDLQAAWSGPNGEMLEMASVTVMRMCVDRGLGWGVKRDMHEMGWVKDVCVFVGRRGDVDVGLGEGWNEQVNLGIIHGCIWGIPDAWVEENVRRWVKYPGKGLVW